MLLARLVALFNKMNATSEVENDTVFWDRLRKMERVKESGAIVEKGSADGGNILRICEGERGHYLNVRFSTTLLLNANIRQWPTDVSADGLTIGIWMMDYAQKRIMKRKFLFTFFTESAAETFFKMYTDSLTMFSNEGLGYREMCNISKRVAGEGMLSEDDENEDDNDEIMKVGEDDTNRKGDEKKGDNVEYELDDSLKEVLAFEQMEVNFGPSQGF